MLENPIVIEKTFRKEGLQRVEVWKDKNTGAYYAIAEDGMPPEKCSFVGITLLNISKS